MIFTCNSDRPNLCPQKRANVRKLSDPVANLNLMRLSDKTHFRLIVSVFCRRKHLESQKIAQRFFAKQSVWSRMNSLLKLIDALPESACGADTAPALDEAFNHAQSFPAIMNQYLQQP